MLLIPLLVVKGNPVHSHDGGSGGQMESKHVIICEHYISSILATISIYNVFQFPLQNAMKDVIIMVFANRVYVAVCLVGTVNSVPYQVAHIIVLIEDNVNKYKVCGNVFVIRNILEKIVVNPRSKSVAMELITI